MINKNNTSCSIPKVADIEEYLRQWDFEKNKVPPQEVSLGSNKKYWWLCPKGHSYDMSFNDKYRGLGCPYCSNRRVLVGYNDLATCNPELLDEWDYEQNVGVSPDSVMPGSAKRVHWICSKCGDRWIAAIRERALKGHGCPKCSKAKRAQSRHEAELARRGPLNDKDLLLDFDYEANYPKTPNDYTRLADTKIHWKCHICGYKWIAKINNRANGKGCPACVNKHVHVTKDKYS